MASDELKSVMNNIVKLSLQFRKDEAVKELTNSFRKLRNKCVQGANIQNEIASYDNLVNSTFTVLQGILENNNITESQDLCLLIGLQMIANLLVNNKEIQTNIWGGYQKIIISCLCSDNPKLQNCALMIMYNVFLGNPEFIVFEKDVFIQIISLLRSENFPEFAVYLLQLYILKTKYIQEIYPSLVPDLRSFILDVILDQIVKKQESLGKELIQFFVERFQSYSENVVDELAKSEYSAEVNETVRILDLLSSMTDNETDLMMIQNDENLVVTSIKLLKTIHSISKEPGNNLSRIQRLSELEDLENQISPQEGVSYGFKANIIRLIGNLCWKNEKNQNKVRELEAIPVLLDCCSIDGRNSFIMQWTILAIRNLCEKNQENQKFIASVGTKGIIDVNKMKEMGILLNKNTDGSSLSIVPLKIHE